MERVMNRVWIGLIVLCTIVPRIGIAESDPIVFGVFPRWNAQITVRDFTPLAALLERELGRPVRIETDKDFDSFMRRVSAREFDIVHLNQLQYLQAHEASGYRAIAKLCDNPTCTIKAIIVTRHDSKIVKVSDLRGKTIAFGDPSAMVSHVLTNAATCAYFAPAFLSTSASVTSAPPRRLLSSAASMNAKSSDRKSVV